MLQAADINAIRPETESMLAVSQCRHGPMMYLRRDWYVGRSLHEYGEFSEGEVEIFRSILRPGDIALDIGANLGAHTIPMARLVGPTGFVFAVEPQRVLFNILCGNIALNELVNIKAFPFALGRAPGVTHIIPLDYSASNNFGGVSLGGAQGDAVPVVTLDQVGLPKARFIKIDVEGMELDVLLGAKEVLARDRPILYVENDRPDKSEALMAQLIADGYRMWWHVPPLFNPDNFRRNADNVFGVIRSFNMLCVPHETQVQLEGFEEITNPKEAADWLRRVIKGEA
ncbi:MAG TPA: FkbM family methyltransferase [Xanthobacteraceae bacterium]|nr:FkbM family methyltransferase [Xanthobacteraceae bacterium]